jgi:hypothetical protein
MEQFIVTAKAITLGVVLAVVVSITGCAGSVSYRAYDPYYRDYHVWADTETPYYNQWVIETHRPRYEYRRLPRRDRETYWRWRHDHH